MVKFHQNTNPGKLQNHQIELSPIPIDAKSRAVSKKVLTLDETHKTKKLERLEILAGSL